MLRDVFYYGEKPNIHPREKPAKDFEEARYLTTTEHFWIVNEFCDYTNFDWDFDFELLDDENQWEQEHINIWPSQHQKDSGTWLCSKNSTDVFIYRTDVEPVIRKKIKSSNWVLIENINENVFDFSWHPDPTSPPYIYKFGCRFYPVTTQAVLEYHVPGATEYCYMDTIVELNIEYEKWNILEDIDKNLFDFTWRPDPTSPPYIYIWGNQHYHGTVMPTVEYHVPGAKEKKYIDQTWHAKLISKPQNFKVFEKFTDFDFSWVPDPTSPPYIYVWGNQYNSAVYKASVIYEASGATEYKYMDHLVKRLPDKTNWIIPDNIDQNTFDFSWEPDVNSHPYTYEWNTQWQKNGGPKYVTPGSTEIKYMFNVNIKATSTKKNWEIIENIDENSFDFSWHPDNTEDPYIYIFGNQHYSAEVMPTIKYKTPNATQIKYVNEIKANLNISKKNWLVPDNIDVTEFDFSWVPNPNDPPFTYQFGTQWQKTGGPKYVIEGATEIKYIDSPKAKALPKKDCWEIPDDIDITKFDFSWHPDETEPPYIYQFGTQHQRTGGPRYIVSDASEIKYINNIKAKKLPNKTNFQLLLQIDEESFDFSWHPDETEDPYIYVFGNQWNKADKQHTVLYTVAGATEYKYENSIVAKLLPDKTNFEIVVPIIHESFDFSWRPDPHDPPYIYVFGNEWYTAEDMPTVKYVVKNATQIKYISDIKAKLKPNYSNWSELIPIDKDKFDFSWVPDPNDPPYIYVFGNKQYPAEKMPTVIYTVEGATEYKYVNLQKATLAQNFEKFKELIPVDRDSFDYSWVPDPHDPPYIYVFGNQWNEAEVESTLEYHVENATEKKFVKDKIAKVLPNYTKWKHLLSISSDFDYSWRPNPKDPPYIYVFGNQWHEPEIEPTVEYHVEGATDYKYVHDVRAKVLPNMQNWSVPSNVDIDDFDFSWRPDPGSPPYIYQFGTLKDDNDGPKYIHPKNAGEVVYKLRVKKSNENILFEIPKYFIETTLEDLVEKHLDEVFWACNKNINYSNFDFNWRPNIEQVRYVHVFGSPDSKETHTYFVSGKMYKQGFTNFNYINQNLKIENEYLVDIFVSPDMFFIDRGNTDSLAKYQELKQRFPNIQKSRYVGSWVDTIYRCLNKCTTQVAWILSSEYDYSSFDFKYYPNPWQLEMVHIFGTQWNQWGNTYMVNKQKFYESTKYVKTIEHLKNLNFVRNKSVKVANCLHDVYLINHGTSHIKEVKLQIEKKIGKEVIIVNYDKDYLTTLKNLVTSLTSKKEHYIWVCSSICNYESFDFTFTPDFYAKENLHVFASNKQKLGDTFLIDVNKLKSLINDLNLLQNYSKISYINYNKVTRFNAPIFEVFNDTHVMSSDEFDFPYAIFYTHDNKNLKFDYQEPLALWDDTTKNIEVLSTGASLVAMPKEIQNYKQGELYNYPYIITSKNLQKSNPLDIIFLSNGEKNADENYEHLLKTTKKLPNRVIRVDSISGRVKAYHAAAKESHTPWLFTVFAKLKVNQNFDFSWQPDRLQKPKHYIFHAENPLNGLIYGHQAMIAYNKKLTLANTGKGLDFTLDDPHSVIGILSGVANFNTDKFSTWRTAFREVIKLKSDYDPVSIERLNIWLTNAKGNFAQDCLRGANDAVDYYDSVSGDIDQLKLSYEWDWLKEYYDRKYK